MGLQAMFDDTGEYSSYLNPLSSPIFVAKNPLESTITPTKKTKVSWITKL